MDKHIPRQTEPSMSKHVPLGDALARSSGSIVLMRFADIERFLGFALPNSAQDYPAWWSNETGPSTRTQRQGWMPAGFRTRHVDLARCTVAFERIGATR